MKRLFNIDDEQWVIRLTDSNELSFSFVIPYEDSIYSTNPLWYSFDENEVYDDSEFETCDTSGVDSSINIFRIKAKLLEEISVFLKMYDVNYFFYRPNSDKKKRIYNSLSIQLKEKLGSDWDLQDCGNWFYFKKYRLNG